MTHVPLPHLDELGLSLLEYRIALIFADGVHVETLEAIALRCRHKVLDLYDGEGDPVDKVRAALAVLQLRFVLYPAAAYSAPGIRETAYRYNWAIPIPISAGVVERDPT